MSALPGNTNAQQGDRPKESVLVVRLTRERKGAYVRAARPDPLALWVQKHLDKACGYEEKAKTTNERPLQ